MHFDKRYAHLLFCCFMAGAGVSLVAVCERKQPQQVSWNAGTRTASPGSGTSTTTASTEGPPAPATSG